MIGQGLLMISHDAFKLSGSQIVRIIYFVSHQ